MTHIYDTEIAAITKNGNATLPSNLLLQKVSKTNLGAITCLESARFYFLMTPSSFL